VNYPTVEDSQNVTTTTRLLLAIQLIAVTTACATVALKPEAAKVSVVTAAPAACRSLGVVYGQGGGYWTVGQFVSNDKLTESAMADARNKAADLGATHIVPSPVQITGESTTATVSAAAYGCP
jgi:hypothetical protein